MQFPRYEFVVPLDAQRTPPDRRPRPRRVRPSWSRLGPRALCARLAAGASGRPRREPPRPLDVQQYLALEFRLADPRLADPRRVDDAS